MLLQIIVFIQLQGNDILVNCQGHSMKLYSGPSTRIRIFLNRHIFCCGFKKIRVHTHRIRIEFARPHVSGRWYPDSL